MRSGCSVMRGITTEVPNATGQSRQKFLKRVGLKAV
jgi:hypothetical protein